MVLYKQDDILTLDIISYGMDGEGVAKENGYVFFVPFAMKGERVRVKVTFVNKKKQLVFCELKETEVKSPFRVRPECNRFEKCGGCDMLHISYEEQLKIKRENVKTLFRKNAGIEIDPEETVGCSTPVGYRNKIQIPFGTVNGEVKMGFFRENTHKIVAITKCFLHGEWAEKLIKVFTEFAREKKLTAYDDERKKGLLRHLAARYVDGQFCLVVVTNGEKLPYANELIKSLDEEIGKDYALYNSVKYEHDNVILGKTMFAIKERKTTINVLGINMEINPYSFLQLNNEIRDGIYRRIIDETSENRNTIVDAYAGVGVLGAVQAKRGLRVYNIEIVKEATEDGEKIAKLNGISDKVTNINGDAAVKLPEVLKTIRQNGENEPIIILDPPRKGCDEKVLKTICETKATKIYYVSCNPATLTRDIKILTQNGYTLNYVAPYDMFPNTKHVEVVTALVLKTPK